MPAAKETAVQQHLSINKRWRKFPMKLERGCAKRETSARGKGEYRFIEEHRNPLNIWGDCVTCNYTGICSDCAPIGSKPCPDCTRPQSLEEAAQRSRASAERAGMRCLKCGGVRWETTSFCDHVYEERRSTISLHQQTLAEIPDEIRERVRKEGDQRTGQQRKA